MKGPTPNFISFWIVLTAMLVLAAVALAAGPAQAATATMTWENPTQREDGTPLASGELKEVQIDYAKCVAGTNTFPATRDGFVAFPFPAVTGQIPNLGYGKWCFRARAIDSSGVASVDTGTVWATYLAPPKPPTLLTVKGLVWDYRLKGGVEELRLVGTIEAGKPCAGLAPITGHDLFTVSRADVKLDRGVKRDATLIAQCQIS